MHKRKGTVDEIKAIQGMQIAQSLPYSFSFENRPGSRSERSS